MYFFSMASAYTNLSYCGFILNYFAGNLLQPIVNLSFAGTSEYLVSASWGLKPQLSVWSMSKLSIAWSYMLHIEGEKSSLLLNRFLGFFLFVSFLEFSRSCLLACRNSSFFRNKKIEVYFPPDMNYPFIFFHNVFKLQT